VDPSGITANFENGVLVVTVPKAAKAQPVHIPVSGSESQSTESQSKQLE
jgi:hypothetical protein